MRQRPVREIANAKGTLADKAMLVRLNIGKWTAKKQAKNISQKAEDDNFAESGTISSRKLLIAKDALSEVESIVSAARKFHQDNTLPWHYDGVNILPATNYNHYTEKMRQFKVDFDNAVQKFILNYPEYVQKAKSMLGNLYCDADYPSQAELSRKYRLIIHVDPLPQAQDFRVSLQSNEVDIIKKELEDSLQVAEKAAMDDLWQRMNEVIDKLHSKLDEKDGKFKNSIIDNIDELMEMVPRLNITGDKNMDNIRKKIDNVICSVNPQDLREDEEYKKEVKKDAKEILDAMAAYCG